MEFGDDFKCPEMLRARITNENDVYIVPFPFTETGSKDFHFSHHKSGEFHWTDGGSHVHPVYGEKDFPAALKLFLGVTSCFCFRKGKNLSDIEIQTILIHVAKYLPFPFNINEPCQSLIHANFCRLIQSELKEHKP